MLKTFCRSRASGTTAPLGKRFGAGAHGKRESTNNKKYYERSQYVIESNEACRNEAKKYLKTNGLFENNGQDTFKSLNTHDMALFEISDLTVLVRRNVQIGAQNRQKTLVSRTTKRCLRAAGWG